MSAPFRLGGEEPFDVPAQVMWDTTVSRVSSWMRMSRSCVSSRVEPPAPYAGLSWTRPGDLIRYEVEVENPTEGAFTQLALEDKEVED